VANVCAGFDVLGFALEGVGDRVTLTLEEGADGARIDSITGVVRDLPTDPAKNTASVAALALLQAEGVRGGLRVSIEKGIALGSGMGGSAASAVAAVVAANQLLERPLARDALLPHAVAGEQVASGAAHADNAAPCLFGGMTAVVSDDPPVVVPVPVPAELRCVVVRPHLRLDTREARAALPESVPLAVHVSQSKRLAGFLAGCFRTDLELIGRSMEDLVAEPARSRLIPGYEAAREAARSGGAIGFGIAGAGPAVFAWVRSDERARSVKREIVAAFANAGQDADGWSGPIGSRGAIVEATA
jgi:homoserine kinase